MSGFMFCFVFQQLATKLRVLIKVGSDTRGGGDQIKGGSGSINGFGLKRIGRMGEGGP